MKRFLGVGILLVPLAAMATTNAPASTGHHHEGLSTTVQNGLQVQCDVMRDYYYNADTGEFLGWAGDTYLANCMSIGSDGSTDPGPCAPGDVDCECSGADAPMNPLCTGDPCKAGSLAKDGCENKPPKPPKKPKCATCLNNLSKNLKQVSNKKETCKDAWAWPIAAQHCNAGELRKPEGGFYTNMALERYLNQNSGVACVNIGNEAICEVMPEWSECMMGWLDGSMHETITQHGGINGVTGTLNGNIPNGASFIPMGSIQGTHSQQDPTHAFDLPAGSGLNGLCQAEADLANLAAWNAFKMCAQNAPDHSGSGTNATCIAQAPQGGGTN